MTAEGPKRRTLGDASAFGPNSEAVSKILDQAEAISLSELAILATSVNSVAGSLGRDRTWQQAQDAAQGVAQADSRTTSVTSARDAAGDCMMRGVQRCAAAKGRNADRIAESWKRYRQAVVGGDAGLKRRAVRKLQRTLIRTIGFNYAKHVASARRAVSNAARAVVVWDLARDQSEFTPAQRSLLVAPWVSAFPLPQELSE
jgi:hypothetical protein